MKSLSALFTDTIFRIPDYQRGFAWNKRNYEDFWNDLTNLKNSNTSEYYVGVLTTQLIPTSDLAKEKWNNDRWMIDSKGYKPYYVVDGQQRLTTAILLLSALLRTVKIKFPEEKQLNYTDLQVIKDRYLYEKKGSTDTYSCIFGYEIADPSHDYYCQEILHMPGFGKTPKKTKYSENMNGAYQYFFEKLKELNFFEIEEYFTLLTQKMVFNMYQISEKLDVFVTFETMNNRGKTLSSLELLKNRLIYLTTIADEDTEDKDKATNTREKINESWKIAYSYLGKNEYEMLDDEDFLRGHIEIYKNDSNTLIKEKLTDKRNLYYDNNILLDLIFTRTNLIENKISLDDILHFAQRIGKNAKLWYLIHNPKESEYDHESCLWIYKYKLLKKRKLTILSFDSIGGPNSLTEIFIFFTHVKNEKKRLQYLRYLTKIALYSDALSSNQLMIRKILELEEKFSHESVIERDYKKAERELVNTLNHENNKDLIIQGLIRSIKAGSPSSKTDDSAVSFYKNRFFPTEYVLKCYELYLLDQNLDYKKDIQRKLDILLNDNQNIEHILPLKNDEVWKDSINLERNSKESNTIINSLGNLMLINMDKNNKLGNKSFKEKIGVLGSQVGYINGTYSEREISSHKEWTEKEILDRGIKLITFYLNLLEMSSCNKTIKKELLGLDFM